MAFSILMISTCRRSLTKAVRSSVNLFATVYFPLVAPVKLFTFLVTS